MTNLRFKVVESAFGKKPLAVRRGGSIPIICDFEQILGAKTILMGFGLERNAIHSPNENFTLDIFRKGIEAVTSTNSTLSFDENDILDLYYSLGDKYVNNASFLLPRTAMKQIRMLKDATSGQYLWNPALLTGTTDTLLGCPIYQSSYMPAVGKGTKSIIFGNFSYYQIVDRIGIRILRDPFTSKPYIRFYTTKRVGGDVINTDAFKGLITSNIE